MGSQRVGRDWVTFTFIVKEIPQSWALLYVTFSPRWPHFWYLHKVKPFKSLESQSTSAWIQVFFMCNSYIIHSVEFETLWASTWNTKTLGIWTFSQMSDHNSFPHSSLEWICQLFLTLVRVCWVASVVSNCSLPLYCSPPGSSAHGILQTRIVEWVAEPSSRGSSQPRDWTHVSYFSCIGSRVLYHLGSPIFYL